jgi:hypothetical protein
MRHAIVRQKPNAFTAYPAERRAINGLDESEGQ